MTLTAFIIDCHDPAISTPELRKRYREGIYGKIRPEYAKGYFEMAGRKAK